MSANGHAHEHASEEEEFELSEGMPIVDTAGVMWGKLSALLIADDAEESDDAEEEQDLAEFMLVTVGDVDRLVPFEAAEGVEDGKLILAIPAAMAAQFPAASEEPTEAEIDLAYDLWDGVLGGQAEQSEN